ncbi:MAG: metallophosphoesterase [Mariprofundaceae bacterium]
MNMMFVGDPHGRYQHIIDAIHEQQPASCILVGDQSYDESIDQLFAESDGETAFHWIHGNHDTDRREWHDSLFGSPWADRSLHGRVEQLCGVRVAGLGGIFRESIWHPDKGIEYASRKQWKLAHNLKKFTQKERKHESTIWPEDYDKLAKQRADILVLHEAPDCHRLGLTVLSQLGERLGVRLIVHGHHHEQYTAVLDSGIAVVGLGLAQVVSLDLNVFEQTKSAEKVIQALSFGEKAIRGGGWMT